MPTTAARFDGLEILVVQDMFSSPLWDRATYQLPGAAFAEREGSYVNHADRLQTARGPSVRRPACGSRGGFIGNCSSSPGCTKPAACWTKLPPRFSIFTLLRRPVPPVGVDLKANLLAAATS